MPYPYGMQSAPAVGNGLGGLPRRQQAETREPLIIEYLSRLRYTASAFTYEIPAGYSKARITLVSRGGDYLGSSTFGGGKAISPVIPVKAGVKVEISFGAAVAQTAIPPASSTVTCGALTMTAVDAKYQLGGTASGGEQNFSGTTLGAGGVGGTGSSTEMGSLPASEGSNQPAGSSPGAPGPYMSGSNTGGGQAMVRIVLW